MAPYTASCPSWDALGSVSIVNLGTTALILPHPAHKVQAHFTTCPSALALNGVPPIMGEDSAAPCFSMELPCQVAGMGQDPAGTCVPPPAELSCPGLKMALFSPPLNTNALSLPFGNFQSEFTRA